MIGCLQTRNKAQWLAACGHVSASSQSSHFILSLRLYSSFITSGSGPNENPIYSNLCYTPNFIGVMPLACPSFLWQYSTYGSQYYIGKQCKMRQLISVCTVHCLQWLKRSSGQKSDGAVECWTWDWELLEVPFYVLEQNPILYLVLVQPRKTGNSPCMTE